jgi:hypothetical protein
MGRTIRFAEVLWRFPMGEVDETLIKRKRESAQRVTLLQRGFCCAVCPHMLSLRGGDSVLTAEVVCQSCDGEAVLPRRTCKALLAIRPDEFRGIDPLIIEKAVSVGWLPHSHTLAA